MPREPRRRNSLRRAPQQDRSRERFESIVETASLVFAERGFEATTMVEIAARAETSIGSLYRFFPHKLSLFTSIADRNIARARALHDAVFTHAALDRPWAEIIDAAIDAFRLLRRTDTGFRATSLNLPHYGVYEKGEMALYDEFIRNADRVLFAKAPQLPPATRRLIASTITYVIAGILFFSDRQGPKMSNALVEETKLLLRRYLAPYLDS